MPELMQLPDREQLSVVAKRNGNGGSTARLRKLWNHRAASWDHEGTPGLERVVEAVLNETEAGRGTVAVDLGCGTGQISLPLAQTGAAVTAVDLSEEMIERLLAKASLDGLDNVAGVVSPIELFDLADESVDLVTSNYALHHLRDDHKAASVAAAIRWLRPGGRLVVGDMMFGRGSTARDRAIIGSKVATLARRGPAGWWRLAKNAGRFTFRLREQPVTTHTWHRYFEDAGFTDVRVVPVVSEAAVVAGTKP